MSRFRRVARFRHVLYGILDQGSGGWWPQRNRELDADRGLIVLTLIATVLESVVAGLTIFVGLLMVALPVGIVATAFANEVHRRDFVVTWGWWRGFPCSAS